MEVDANGRKKGREIRLGGEDGGKGEEEEGLVSIKVTLSNAGERDGHEIVQLYLSFPASAGEPLKQLKGFRKVLVFLSPSLLPSLLPNLTSLWALCSLACAPR